MLSTILWVLGGVVALIVIYFVLKIFFIVMGVKKMLGVVKEEIEHMPTDYQNMRKEVKNEGATTGEAAKGFARKTLDRWYKKM
jgi:uncharacterized membrane protein